MAHPTRSCHLSRLLRKLSLSRLNFKFLILHHPHKYKHYIKDYNHGPYYQKERHHPIIIRRCLVYHSDPSEALIAFCSRFLCGPRFSTSNDFFMNASLSLFLSTESPPKQVNYLIEFATYDCQ